MNNKKGKFATPLYPLLFVCLMSCLVLACGTSKKVVEAPAKPIVHKDTNAINPQTYLDQQIHWEGFNSKAEMHIEHKEINQDVVTNLRMRKDKEIWASVMVFPIEVAKASITPDSLRAIIKIGKKAYALSYQEGLQLIHAQVEFASLQNIFLGNPLMMGLPIDSWTQTDSLITIKQKKDEFTQVLTYNKHSGYLEKQEVQSLQRNFHCKIRYEKYAPITNKQPFAFNKYITITNNAEKTILNLEFSKAELDGAFETNFSIPDGYKRIPIKK
jgi:hypothetical protein